MAIRCADPSRIQPQLVIDASGNVVKQTGVTFSRFGDNISIDPIQSPGPGQVLFEGKSTLTGTNSTFTFNRAAERVEITTSKGNLFVSEVTALATANAGLEPKVTIDVPTNTFEFDVQSDFPATEVNISNLDPAPSQFGIRLGGLIDNPIGTTKLVAVGGIYSANFAQREGVVRTNRLLISTQGDAGKDVPDEIDRIPIDIVESPNRPASISVSAGKSIYVGIKDFCATGCKPSHREVRYHYRQCGQFVYCRRKRGRDVVRRARSTHPRQCAYVWHSGL